MPPLRQELIETERIRLRPFASADAEELLAVFRDAEVRRYLLDDLEVSAEWVQNEIATSEARFAQSGTGLWSIRTADDPRIVGFVGFREFFDPPQMQLLYGLLPDCWGRGLATEAAARICELAFRELGFLEVLAATDLPNQASVEVLRRLGMRQVRTSDDGVAGTVFFSLDRHDWLAAQGT